MMEYQQSRKNECIKTWYESTLFLIIALFNFFFKLVFYKFVA